jgi:hypothetical protein
MSTGNAPGFGSDPTDNRALLDWKSRYPDEANRHIRYEAIYLGFLLAVGPVLMLLLTCEIPHRFWVLLGPQNGRAFTTYGLAWLGGMLGGTLYAIKWLYHVVARELWNQDRRLWRLFTPHISGGFAFAIVALIASGIMKVLDARATNSHSEVIGIAFLVGYFSDSAVAKLSEIAETLFGQGKPQGSSIDAPALSGGIHPLPVDTSSSPKQGSSE